MYYDLGLGLGHFIALLLLPLLLTYTFRYQIVRSKIHLLLRTELPNISAESIKTSYLYVHIHARIHADSKAVRKQKWVLVSLHIISALHSMYTQYTYLVHITNGAGEESISIINEGDFSTSCGCV